MMRAAFLALLLSALPSVAGGITVSVPAAAGTADGGMGLTIGDVATSADVVLFVDPLGSDSNLCTSSGASACLTIQGAINKVPKLLRHRVTVNIAPTLTYAGVIVSGFAVDPSVQQSTAGILFDGALANSTLATGSATGTATSGTAGTAAGSVHGTLTDTTATWTVDDLVGRFIVITGGTGSGQTFPITTNTATVITVAGTWTAPNATSTYAIQDPSVGISTTTPAILNPIGTVPLSGTGLASAIQVVNNNLAASQVMFRNIRVAVTGAVGFGVAGAQAAFLTQMQIQTTTSGVAINATDGALITASKISILSASSGPILVTRANGNFSNSLIRTTAVSTGAAITVTDNSRFSMASSQTRSLGCVTVTQQSTGTVGTGSRCDCNSISGSAGVRSGSNSDSTTLAPLSSTMIFMGSTDVSNCTYGVVANASGTIAAQLSSSTWTGAASTYALLARYGGNIITSSTTNPTMTGTTAEVTVDNGATNSSYAIALAASKSCLASLATGSRVCRQ